VEAEAATTVGAEASRAVQETVLRACVTLLK
jgi:hypothetical protein